jgi:hypothetical protein
MRAKAHHRSTPGAAWHRLLVAGLLALLALSGCGAPPAGRLSLADGSETLDGERIAAAARPLLDRGAALAVIVVERGDDSGEDLGRRLAAAGMLEGGEIAPGALALYVSFAPRYSELRAGGRWSRALPAAALRAIRLEHLNPELRGGRLSDGVAGALAALDARLTYAESPAGRIVALLTWQTLAFGAFLAFLALWLSPLGGWLWGVAQRSPPGRLAQWLIDRTPAGRRRLERDIGIQRGGLAQWAEFAHSWCRAVVSSKRPEAGALAARRKLLDQERKRAERALRGRALLNELRRLSEAYKQLGHQAWRLSPEPKPEKAKRRPGHAASYATSDFAPPAASPSSEASSSDWSSGSSSSDSSPSSDGGSW